MSAVANEGRAPARRVRIGDVPVDAVTFAEALDAVEALVRARRGGRVFTPNVDHVVNARENADLRAAYAAVDLSLADGMPLVWGSRLLGGALPERVAGSDLALPLLERAARRGWRVYLLGGAPGVAAMAAEEVRRGLGLEVVGFDAPVIALGPEGDAGSSAAVARVRAARPDLLLVGLGSPKQEIWIHRHAAELAPAVALGVGATLDFLAGRLRRAPRWMRRGGLEWLHRLASEPRRLWRRYLVQDPQFVVVLARSWQRARRARRAAAPAGGPP